MNASFTNDKQFPPTERRAQAAVWAATEAEPAIAGSGGHNTAIKVAGNIRRGFDLTEEEALDVFLQIYNPRCTPPWNEAEARHKVQDAGKGSRRSGWMLKKREPGRRAKESKPVSDEEFARKCKDSLDRARNPKAIDRLAKSLSLSGTTIGALVAEGSLGADPHFRPVWIWPGTYQIDQPPGSDPKRLSAKGRKFKGWWRSAHMPEESQAIFVCEGAKDAAAVIEVLTTCMEADCACHVMATSSAGSWKPEHCLLARGRNVYVILDRDNAGKKGAKTAVQRLIEAGASAVWVFDWERTEKEIGNDFHEILVTGGLETAAACIQNGFREVYQTPAENAGRDASAMNAAGGLESLLGEIEKATENAGAYFLAERSRYYLRNASGRWIALTTGDYKRHLKRAGFSTKPAEGELLSDADNAILAVQDFRDIAYAGPLAGRESGFYERNGVRFLVTESPRLIRPSDTVDPTAWPTLRGFFQGLLGSGEHGEAQLTTFYGWLKVAHRGLLDFHDRKTERRPEGQALGIVGPRCCGKSLLQLLIKEILGGRAAKVAGWVCGRREFNAEAFMAENLMLDDEVASKDGRAREHFGAKLKSIVGSQVQECHRKRQTPVNLEPFWRITISCNDEPEALLVLPPLTVDVEDKLILLRAEPSDFPMPADTVEAKAKFWDALTGELEVFVTWLESWPIPERFRDVRYGVSTFHHPEIREALSSMAPETRLLELIDAARVWEPGTTWEGTAAELEGKLKSANGYVLREADRLLSWGNACGTYLGRIEKRFPDRVRRDRTNQRRGWIIEAPQETL